jgi:hypothetical protein
MVQPKVGIPAKDAKEVAKTVLLLKKRAKTSNLMTKTAIELQLMTVSGRIRSLAEAQLRDENPPAESQKNIRQKPGNLSKVDREWAQVIREYDEKRTTWANPAIDSETRFENGLESYIKALNPLVEAFQSAASSNIRSVKSKAKSAYEMLSRTQRTIINGAPTGPVLIPLSNASNTARGELQDFCSLVKTLNAKPPRTLADIKGARARLDEAIEKVRATQRGIESQVTAINRLAKMQQASLESLVTEVVVAAVAQREKEHIREATEVLKSLLSAKVGAVQALDGEPMSALALQDVHSLIKGLCDSITVGAAAVK